MELANLVKLNVACAVLLRVQKLNPTAKNMEASIASYCVETLPEESGSLRCCIWPSGQAGVRSVHHVMALQRMAYLAQLCLCCMRLIRQDQCRVLITVMPLNITIWP